jgi:hypothetical protein
VARAYRSVRPRRRHQRATTSVHLTIEPHVEARVLHGEVDGRPYVLPPPQLHAAGGATVADNLCTYGVGFGRVGDIGHE